MISNFLWPPGFADIEKSTEAVKDNPKKCSKKEIGENAKVKISGNTIFCEKTPKWS